MCLSLCVYRVCLLFTILSCAKTDRPIELPFGIGLWTWMGLSNNVLDGRAVVGGPAGPAVAWPLFLPQIFKYLFCLLMSSVYFRITLSGTNGRTTFQKPTTTLDGDQDPPREGVIWGGALLSSLWSIEKIWHAADILNLTWQVAAAMCRVATVNVEPAELLGRWQQRCGRSLSVLQQLLMFSPFSRNLFMVFPVVSLGLILSCSIFTRTDISVTVVAKA